MLKVKIIVTFIILMGIGMSVSALPMPPVPTEPLYYEPTIVEATDVIRGQSCINLDNAIRYLHPHRYSYKPSFYQDKFNQVATAAVLTGNIPFVTAGEFGLAFLGYSYFIDEKQPNKTTVQSPVSKEKKTRDVISKVIIALTTLSAVKGAGLGLSYLAYSSLVDEKEQRRMMQVEQQISMLQQVKAEKHCFE